MNFYFVDKILPFLKNNNNTDFLINVNLFQFYIRRFGLGLCISKKINKNAISHNSLKVKNYLPNLINQKIKYVFVESLNNLDITLNNKMNFTLVNDLKLYTYRGDRLNLRLPLHGQRRRANAKTVKKIMRVK